MYTCIFCQKALTNIIDHFVKPNAMYPIILRAYAYCLSCNFSKTKPHGLEYFYHNQKIINIDFWYDEYSVSISLDHPSGWLEIDLHCQILISIKLPGNFHPSKIANILQLSNFT